MADCIAVYCCEDRTRKLVLDYLEDQLGMSTVNVETDQNPSLMLAGNPASAQTSRFIKRVHLLAQSFGVEIVAVIAHHSVTEANKSVDPIKELTRAIQCLAQYCTQQKVIGLWVDETRSVRHFNVIQDSEE